ncbi:MAG: rod shape-determining protein MreC [Moraxella sp.]|nr:rod shape-determining protein MreC [Moraxella sp.]
MSSLFADHPLLFRKTLALAIFALVLVLFDSKNPEWFSKVRSASHAAMQPIYQFSLIPSGLGHWADGQLETKESLRRENIRLQTELLQAKARLQQQDYLVAQNSRLKGVLSTIQPDNQRMLMAQVIGTDTNPLKQIVVLNKGASDGVQIGQTVIDENGILGQVINTYPNTSRLLLITDEQQSVSVTVARTGQRAMVTGGGRLDALSLDYIFKTADVMEGDVLISSGLGDRIPAGYKVGTITSIDTTRTDSFADIAVLPAANFLGSSYVLILQDKS